MIKWGFGVFCLIIVLLVLCGAVILIFIGDDNA